MPGEVFDLSKRRLVVLSHDDNAGERCRKAAALPYTDVNSQLTSIRQEKQSPLNATCSKPFSVHNKSDPGVICGSNDQVDGPQNGETLLRMISGRAPNF